MTKAIKKKRQVKVAPKAAETSEVAVVSMRRDGVCIGWHNGGYVRIEPDNIEPWFHPEKKKEQLPRWRKDGSCYVVVKDMGQVSEVEAPVEPSKRERVGVTEQSAIEVINRGLKSLDRIPQGAVVKG